VHQPTVRKAFTLVELLVVIGIIAVLISVLLPVLGRVREQGNQVKCMSNLRQIGMAMVAYATDNKGYFPAAARGVPRPGEPAGGGVSYAHDWVYWQQPNLPGQSPALFWPATNTTRPLADQRPERGGIAKYLGKSFVEQLFICPSDQREPTNVNIPYYRYSYCMNGFLASTFDKFDSQSYAYFGRLAKLSAIRYSSNVVLMLEESESSINDGDCTIVRLGPAGSGMWQVWPGGSSRADWLAIRHDKKRRNPENVVADGLDKDRIPNSAARGNVAFADGHVEYVTREFVHSPQGRHWDWMQKSGLTITAAP
jgi:prepilin-type N-terminal cleavage/methylation domain-containing protein/prepilin-type processing-associated H-X9-DG protein